MRRRTLEANCANVQRQESLCHREDNARTSSKRGVFASSHPFWDEDFSRWYKLSHFYFHIVVTSKLDVLPRRDAMKITVDWMIDECYLRIIFNRKISNRAIRNFNPLYSWLEKLLQNYWDVLISFKIKLRN